MTCDQLIKSLTPAQRKLFAKLSEPRYASGLFVYGPSRKPARALVVAGLAEYYGNGLAEVRLTDLGKIANGPVFTEPPKD
jgi:hypothetical protein